MSQNHRLKRMNDLVRQVFYEAAIYILEGIKDEEIREHECYTSLACMGIQRAAIEHGEVVVLDDRDKYEMAKIGMGNCSSHAVLHRGGEDNLYGTEEMLDYVPEDNALKQYFRTIEKD